jgi:diguanylate cyclase (GGDEF)-like protein
MPPIHDTQGPFNRQIPEESGAGRLPELRSHAGPVVVSAQGDEFLLGRAAFLERVRAALLAAQLAGRRFGIAVLDVDRTRLASDARGAAGAEAALLAAARRLAGAMPGVKHLARLGGGEFAMLLPGAHDDVGLGLALSEIIESVEAPLPGESGPVTLLASAGGCLGGGTVAGSESEAMHLLATAKQEMYRAKRFDHDRQSR